jgi:amino acid permease
MPNGMSTGYTRLDEVVGEGDAGTVITPALRRARLEQLDRPGVHGEGVPLGKGKTGGGFFTPFAYTVNYVFGAGVLSIPYSVAHAGIIGSCLCMMVSATISAIGMIWSAEALGRAEGILRSQEEDELQSPTLQSFGSRPENRGDAAFRLSGRRIEISELCTIFLGKFWGAFYTVLAALYCIISMWFYGVIFSLSMTQTFPLPLFPSTYVEGKWYEGTLCDLTQDVSLVGPECRETYTLYCALFLLITMVVSCADLAGQKMLQVGFTIFGLGSILCMVVTILVSWALHPYEGHVSNVTVPGDLPGYQTVDLWLDPSGFSTAVMNFVFAFLCHQGVPGILQMVQDKSKVPQIFSAAMFAACICYMTLGAVAASYFGQDPHYGIQKLVTLNWRNYNGDEDPLDRGNALTIFISYMIRLYPVMSVTAAFALYADTAGSVIRAALCPNLKSKWAKIFLRWVVIWLSLLGTAMKSDITIIVNIGGLMGIIIVMFIPGALQLASKKKCQEEFGRSRTPFEIVFSPNIFQYAIIGVGMSAGSYAIYHLVAAGS